MRAKIAVALALAIVLLTSVYPARVAAQALEPPWPRPIAAVPGVSVAEYLAEVSIEGPIAQVSVTQAFRNDSSSVAEGSFLFPLPEDAAVGDFQMTVDGTVLEGRVMDSAQARHIYEETVRQLRDPALLEYADRGLFQTSAFPIPPGETRELAFHFGMLLTAENGLYRFDYPLRLLGASVPPERTELAIHISSDDGIRTIYSPSHDVDINKTGNREAAIHYSSEGMVEQSDFALYYGISKDSVGVNLISNRPAGEDGYFVLLATPGIEVASDEIVDRNVVFVLDVSGSMEGPKLAQAKDAVRHVVERLNPGDRFNLIAFSTGARLWNDKLTAVTPDAIADALTWIEQLDASGSTDINRALLEALAQLGTDSNVDGVPCYVLFMTDGLPTQGETDIDKIIRNANVNRPDGASIRLFTFGVGFDVNTDLLDILSRDLGGRSRYVRPDEPIDESVSDFYATIQKPVLTNVEVEFGAGVAESDLLPYPLPDLFAGEQLIVAGRYRHGGNTSIRLRGNVGAKTVTYEYPELLLVDVGGEPFVARLWATRKIGALLDEIRAMGPETELVDAVVDLSMRYGIVTPYTSYLVEQPDIQSSRETLDDGDAQPRKQMLSSARESVFAATAEEAAAPASGEAAVQSSIARESLRSAQGVDAHQGVRFAGGRTFVSAGTANTADGQQATLWVDTSYSEDQNVETVAFASDRYFRLASDPDVAEILALSTEVLFVMDGDNAIRITAEKSGTSQESDPAQNLAQPQPTTGKFWDSLMLWLAGKRER
ncbi:MAG: VIT domain-containing protein [Caldilineaceae bacterium]